MAFDLKALAVNTATPIVVKKKVTSLSLRKPKGGKEFFRIRPGAEWTIKAWILKIDSKQEGEGTFLVAPNLLSEVIETKLLKLTKFHIAISFGASEVFLTEVPEPAYNSDGNLTDNEFNRTRREAYEVAEEKWIKLQMNDAQNAWNYIYAVSKLPEPSWPDFPSDLNEAFQLAFKDRYIEDINHPELKKLRGEL